MALIKLPSGKYQVKIRGVDQKWITRAFSNKKEAEVYEIRLKQAKISGLTVTNSAKLLTFDAYFTQWHDTVKHQETEGWRKHQLILYNKHIRPHLGGQCRDRTCDLKLRRLIRQSKFEANN